MSPPINPDTPKTKLENHVLVIDDDKFIHKFVSKAVDDKFNVSFAETGRAGIEKAKALDPDIILLDVEMPGINGYEVCDVLKQDEFTRSTPVIFLSGKSEIREKMIGYEVGGVDFVTKPCEDEELIAKLMVHSTSKKQNQLLERQAKSASKAAHAALTDNSLQGKIVQFVDELQEIHSFELLSEHIFRLAKSFSLKCCLLVQSAEQNYFFSSSSAVTPIEKDLMVALLMKGKRFHDFGIRTQINYPRLALLIKNMPLNHREEYGRIKDLLPAALNAADARVQTLDTENALRNQSDSLNIVLENINNTLFKLSGQLTENQNKIISTLKSMLAELEAKLPHMGLEDDQEAYLLERIDQAVSETLNHNKQSTSIKSSYATISRLLKHVADQQKNLLDAIFNTPNKQQEVTSSPQQQESSGDSDVELF